MTTWDIDDVLDTLIRAWRAACLEADRLDESDRGEFRAWLQQTGVLPRYVGLLEKIQRGAERVGYFERGMRFSRELVSGFVSGAQMARDRGDLPRRVQLTLDLDALPPAVRTHD